MKIAYRIVEDTFPTNPREDHDHLSRFIADHPRMDIGDKEAEERLEISIVRYANLQPRDTEKYHWDDESSDHYILDSVEKMLEKAMEENIVVAYKPLYVYEHGGITISTEPFSCPWDSGQIGWAYVLYEDAKEWHLSGDVETLREKAMNSLLLEVEEYDQYLRGDVWGAVVTEDGDEIDSVWGLYGRDYAEKEAESLAVYHYQSVKSGLEKNLSEFRKRRTDLVKTLIRNRVPQWAREERLREVNEEIEETEDLLANLSVEMED